MKIVILHWHVGRLQSKIRCNTGRQQLRVSLFGCTLSRTIILVWGRKLNNSKDVRTEVEHRKDLKFIMKGKEGKGMWFVFEEIWEPRQWELRVDEGRGRMELWGRWGSGSTKEWEKYRPEAHREDSNKLKSDAGVRLVNIVVQSLEFYVGSCDSFFLSLANTAYMPTAYCWLMWPKGVSFLQRPHGRGEESKSWCRGGKNQVPVSLDGSHWVWSKRLRTQLFLLLLP